jgi:hypothetical protein
MGRTVVFVENFFRTTQFTGHEVSASSEKEGHESWRVGTDRRGGETYWTPEDGDENTAHWVKVECDRVRAADMIAIDRDSNLLGERIRIQVSQDDFTSYTEIASIVLPTQVFGASRLSQKPGVLTSENAWLYRFPQHAGKYWRLYVDAMGTDLKPEVTGVYLGLSWRLTVPLVKPFSFGRRELSFTELTSKSLWAATADVAQRRNDVLKIRCHDWPEYDLARYHIEEQYLAGQRMWIVHDEDRAEHALFAFAPAGVAGFDVPQGRAFPEGDIPYREHEPALR